MIYVRGGAYAEDSPTPASRFDHQKGYFDFWLDVIGIKDVRTLVVESTSWGGKEKTAESIARGKQEAAKMAASF
jgi:FMN-dependent NADH-azoreductase